MPMHEPGRRSVLPVPAKERSRRALLRYRIVAPLLTALLLSVAPSLRVTSLLCLDLGPHPAFADHGSGGGGGGSGGGGSGSGSGSGSSGSGSGSGDDGGGSDSGSESGEGGEGDESGEDGGSGADRGS